MFKEVLMEQQISSLKVVAVPFRRMMLELCSMISLLEMPADTASNDWSSSARLIFMFFVSFSLDRFVNFQPMDRDLHRSLDAQPDLVAPDLNHNNLDQLVSTADHNCFVLHP
jgi:hypothetical protein